MNNEDGFYEEIPVYYCKICNRRIYPDEAKAHRDMHNDTKPRELYESIKNRVIKWRYDYVKGGYSIHYGIPVYDEKENEVQVMRIAIIGIDETHETASINLETSYNVGDIRTIEQNSIEYIDLPTMLRDLDAGFARLRNMAGPVYEEQIKQISR